MDHDEPRPQPYAERTKAPDRYGRHALVRYSEALAEAICDRLAAGEVWEDFCNLPGFPCRRSIQNWCASKPRFGAMVEEARRLGGENRFDEAYKVAKASTHETVNSDKLRVGLLMTQAGKLDPDRYGSRGPGGAAAQGPTRMIVVRHFERARREDGTEYVRAIDDIQQVEDHR